MSFLGTYLRRNHLALLALFVALGGTSYAAIVLPKGSVGSKQLRAHSVTPSKVARATVAMFRGQTGAPGRAGLTGPKGDPGPQGLKGDTGLQGPLGPTFGTSAAGSPPSFYNACTVVPFVSKTFTLARPGMLYIAPAGAGAYANGNSNTSVQYDVQLRNSADTTTLSDISTASYMNWSSGMAAAPLPAGAIMPASDGSPYLAAPGTYIARLTAEVSGSCAPTNLTTFGSTHLSIIEIGSTG